MKIKAPGSRFTVQAVKLILLLEIATVVPCRAETPNMHSAEFRSFYAQFSEAVRANDKNKVADLIAFPVKDWSVERKGNVETISIPTKAEFLRKYDSFFTAFMRAQVLKTKPQQISDDHYSLIWRDSNAEFSFQFEYVAGSGFRVTAYGIGPW
jgi:hypothetical protein